VDATFDRNVLRIGRRLALKLLNVSRFVLLVLDRAGISVGALSRSHVDDADDVAWLGDLDDAVAEATDAFESFRHDVALRTIETAFWRFCDDYVEAVKSRAYGDLGEGSAASARASLAVSLATFQRLLAPFLPFACEEAWSWWQAGSVHRAPWPTL
jgi:valyl-tRNA synthetase